MTESATPNAALIERILIAYLGAITPATQMLLETLTEMLTGAEDDARATAVAAERNLIARRIRAEAQRSTGQGAAYCNGLTDAARIARGDTP